MDWSIFWATFTTIFIAEMGDKTQFAALAASAESDSMFPVWLAVVLALGLAGTLGVLFGRVLGQYLPPDLTRWLSGGLFVAMGLWIMFAKEA